jgi:excisionase family DNA binding protein
LAKKKKYHERVGRKIQEIREKCGETIPDLSEKSGLTENALQSIEAGRRDIKVSELFEISKALDVRISPFLNPCDSKFYTRRKEESVECYISLKKLSDIIAISGNSLMKLCQNDEIPHEKFGGKYFFKASEINIWLKNHLGVKKKVKKDEKQILKIYGIEPLVTTREAAIILGVTWGFIYRLVGTIPYYRIGGRYKFKVSDIENFREKKRIESWEISTRIGRWKSMFVWPEPSLEEKMAEDASFKRKYNEHSRPGYIAREKYFEGTDFEDLKQEVEQYIQEQIRVKTNVLECDYSVITRLKKYGCHLKWWGLPDGREDYWIHSTGLSAENPDKLRDKVDIFIKKKVPDGDFIEVFYYTWGFSWNEKSHCARVTYYVPRVKKDMRKQGT